MSIQEIIRLAKSYLTLGLAVTAAFAVLFVIGYFFIYKKLMKGTKRLKARAVLLAAVSVCYLAALLGALFLRMRGYGEAVWMPFASYVQAWNGWNAADWRNILLNIALFLPFGFLLPLWGLRFRTLWRTALCGFLFSLAVELTQLVTAYGIFETDDLIGNTLGVCIGFGLVMLSLSIVRKEKPPAKRVFGLLAPLLAVCLAFSGIFGAYALQELGNLSEACCARVNMGKIVLSAEAELSAEAASAMLYRTADTQKPEALAQALFHATGAALDPSQTISYDNSIFYYAQGRDIIITVARLGNTYRYTDFSVSHDGINPVAGADETAVRAALAKLGAEPPVGCVFEAGEQRCSFTASMLACGDVIADGTLYCDYYDDGTVKHIENNILILAPYRTVDILSEAEAYARIEKGYFYPSYTDARIGVIFVKGAELTYALDSKGFYRPVYRLACSYGGSTAESEAVIVIPAMR